MGPRLNKLLIRSDGQMLLISPHAAGSCPNIIHCFMHLVFPVFIISSSHPAGTMHVSLAEALEVRGGPLQEEEVWAVLSQSAESLQELFHKGTDIWMQM